jgi:ribonuclease HI
VKRAVLQVYADGSGAEKMGRPGGYAFVAVLNDSIILSGQGYSAVTTCLVMELEAARAGLSAVLTAEMHSKHDVLLLSDSKIALDVAAGLFVPKPAKYHSLSGALRQVSLECHAKMKWIRAHNGNKWNEYVDELAAKAKKFGGTGSLK